jgi:acyl-coenzyme A synthetase/AMP-(fatty) acid ligase
MLHSLHDASALACAGVTARSMKPFFGVQPALLHSSVAVRSTTTSAAAAAAAAAAAPPLAPVVVVNPPNTPQRRLQSVGVFVLKKPWPSVCRTVWSTASSASASASAVASGDALYRELYLSRAPGYFWTGDAATYVSPNQSAVGDYTFNGRLDDVWIVDGSRVSAPVTTHSLHTSHLPLHTTSRHITSSHYLNTSHPPLTH